MIFFFFFPFDFILGIQFNSITALLRSHGALRRGAGPARAGGGGAVRGRGGGAAISFDSADEDEEAYESPSASGARSRGTEEEGDPTAGSPDSRPRSASAPVLQVRRHVRTGSFQRFRQQMQRAWAGWRRGSGEEPQGAAAEDHGEHRGHGESEEPVEHLCGDDLAFIFSLKVSDNAPLYGVCLHVQEIVQRAPGILGAVSPLNQTSYKPSRFLVSAPRCYCLLTRVPFC